MPEPRFACLTYHRLGDEDNPYVVSERQLREQLGILRTQGYVVEGFEQLEARLRLGSPFPEPYVVLTIDDGHVSSLQAADLFAEYGCQATFFVTRDRSRSKVGYIGEAQIRELRQRGFSLGSHGATHRKLSFLAEAECRAELTESREWLEDVLGEPVRFWAAPGGYVNGRVLKLAAELGYALAATCREWMNSPARLVLPAEVNRVNVRRRFSTRRFLAIIEGRNSFYLARRLRAAALWLPKQLLRD